MVYSNELIGSGSNMEVRLFFIDEKRVRNPNVLDEFRSHGERFHSGPFPEGQPGIRPELTKVEVQGEVLTKSRSVSVHRVEGAYPSRRV